MDQQCDTFLCSAFRSRYCAQKSRRSLARTAKMPEPFLSTEKETTTTTTRKEDEAFDQAKKREPVAVVVGHTELLLLRLFNEIDRGQPKRERRTVVVQCLPLPPLFGKRRPWISKPANLNPRINSFCKECEYRSKWPSTRD